MALPDRTKGDVGHVNDHDEIHAITRDTLSEKAWINVQSPAHGAFGDGTTDDTAAIQAAIDAGSPVYLPDASFRIESKLTNPALVPIFGPGELVFTGSGEAAVELGGTSGGANVYDHPFPMHLKVTRATQDLTDAFAAVEMIRCFGVPITVEVEDFHTGLKLTGTDGASGSAGCAYNQIKVVRIKDCLKSIHLHATGTSGYVNQNRFDFGRIGASISSASRAAGILFENDSSDDNAPNGNTFYSPSFELTNNGAGDAVPIEGAYSGSGTAAAEQNYLYGVRHEMGTAVFWAGAGLEANFAEFARDDRALNATENAVDGDNDAETVTLASNTIRTARDAETWALVPLCPPIRRSNLVAENSQVWAPPYALWTNTDTTTSRKRPLTLAANRFDETNGRLLGVLVDFSDEDADDLRWVMVRTISPTGKHGRVGARCYDSGGNILTNSDVSSGSFNSGTGFHRTGSDGSNNRDTRVFRFASSVDKVLIGVAAGSASAELESIEFFVSQRSRGRLDFTEPSGSVSPVGFISENPVANVQPDASTGDVTGMFAQDYTTSGAGWSFDGTTWWKVPFASDHAYTLANVTEDRNLDADSTTLAEVADVLGTLIDDLRDRGYLQTP